MLWEIVNLQNVGKAESTRVVNRRHRGGAGDDSESKFSATVSFKVEYLS